MFLLIHLLSKSIHFFPRGRNGEQAPGSQWAGSGRQLDLRLSSASPGGAGGPRAASPAPRSPRGARLRRDAHLAAAATPGNVRGRGSAWGQYQATRRRPCTFRPVCEAGQRRTMGPVVGLPRGARPTAATSFLPLRPAAPTPPHFQRPLSPRQQEGAEVGIAWGRKVQLQGIFSSRGELCNPRLPPRPPPTAPITHSLSLSRQQGRRRSRGGHSPGCQLLGEVSAEGLL